MRISVPLITILAITFSACHSSNEKQNQSVTDKATQQAETNDNNPEDEVNEFGFTLDDYKGFPVEISGCSCYFSETSTKFKNEEYLFVADFDSIGLISINQNMEKLKLTSTTRAPDTFGDYDHVDVYKSENYTVTLDVKYKNLTGSEVWWNEGTILVENKDGKKISKKIVGECGC